MSLHQLLQETFELGYFLEVFQHSQEVRLKNFQCKVLETCCFHNNLHQLVHLSHSLGI